MSETVAELARQMRLASAAMSIQTQPLLARLNAMQLGLSRAFAASEAHQNLVRATIARPTTWAASLSGQRSLADIYRQVDQSRARIADIYRQVDQSRARIADIYRQVDQSRARITMHVHVNCDGNCEN